MQNTRNITGNVNSPAFQDFKNWMLDQLVNPLLAFATACAIAYFIFGIVKFFMFREAGSGTDGKLFKEHVLFGLIGLVIILGVWGIVGLIGSFTGSSIQIKP